MREFSKFRDFSENRSVLFPSALTARLQKEVLVSEINCSLADRVLCLEFQSQKRYFIVIQNQMSTRKKGAGIRLAPPPTRKPNTKNSHGEDGETLPLSETGDVDQHAEDDDVEEHNVPIDMASFQKQFAKMQKQLAQLAQHMPSTKPRASNDKAAAGPQSTTSSTITRLEIQHRQI
jgi:hypothetical protein